MISSDCRSNVTSTGMRDQWERSFAINVTAPLMLIEGFWESMRSRWAASS